MDAKAIRRAALITLRRTIRERFPPIHGGAQACGLTSRQGTVALLSNSESSFGRSNMVTRSMIWGLAAGVMMLGGAGAWADTAEQAVIAAEDQSTKAAQTNNADLFASLLADKIVSTDNEGTVIVGKAANVADFKLVTWTSDEVTDLKVTVYGDTAIATSTYAAKGTYKGKPFDSRGRSTDTWVKMNGKWLLVATHYSHIKN